MLRYPVVVVARLIAFMSGILAIYRELYALYSGKAPSVSVFWECVWIAFILSSFVAWMQEYWRASTAETSLSDRTPKLYLEYVPTGTANHISHSGLSVGNSGKNDALTVWLKCRSKDRVKLEFEDMPIQRIGANSKAAIQVWINELNQNGVPVRVGGTLGMQIEGCFGRMNDAGIAEVIPVTITCLDHARNAHTEEWVIKREGDWLATKKIWCEPLLAASRK